MRRSQREDLRNDGTRGQVRRTTGWAGSPVWSRGTMGFVRYPLALGIDAAHERKTAAALDCMARSGAERGGQTGRDQEDRHQSRQVRRLSHGAIVGGVDSSLLSRIVSGTTTISLGFSERKPDTDDSWWRAGEAGRRSEGSLGSLLGGNGIGIQSRHETPYDDSSSTRLAWDQTRDPDEPQPPR